MAVQSRLARLLCLAAAASGCGVGAKQPPSTTPDTPAAPAPSVSAAPPEPIVPAPALELRAETAGRTVAPILRNRHHELISISGRLAVERKDGDAWHPVPVETALRWSCETPAEPCLSLAPGAEFLPPPWEGGQGPSQCGCANCPRAASGTYRFVVSGCEKHYRVESEPFELR